MQITPTLESSSIDAESNKCAEIHGCSYCCRKPACIEAQREYLRDRIVVIRD